MVKLPGYSLLDHGAALITVSERTGFYSIIRIFIVLLLRIVAIFICLCWMQANTQDHRAERLKKHNTAAAGASLDP